MPAITDLPLDVLEQIILELDPLDVAAISQTCSAFSTYIYSSSDTERLWRTLYLSQPLDDLRKCYDQLGNPHAGPVDWMRHLQRAIRARTIIGDPAKCRPEERCIVLQTLLDLVGNLPPSPSFLSEDLSLNLVWLAALLRGGTLLSHELWEPSEEERQLRSRLHAYYGLTTADYRAENLKQSRAYVYDMRRYTWGNDFGPYSMDGSGRVNWEHVQAVHHLMSMQVVPPQEDADGEQTVFTIFPLSLPYCQSIIPADVDLGQEDWAGVAGSWQCSFCFCDHRQLLVLNNFIFIDGEPEGPQGDQPLTMSVLEREDFVEVFRTINIEIRVISTETDPAHPSRPKINWVGSIGPFATMVGSVHVTPDNHIRWHFKSGELGNAMWSSEGIQIGGVRSSYGILGSWTTVHHEPHDPVGPFWLRKIHPSPQRDGEATNQDI
ncbi:uncharacterized protein B0H18DRAFT_974101 [Fomitopsis serialis]|uniref:uncharacterized protein n=1 Tax=Fomitopsis serialis TaxID=139415 RepID=UPI002008981C|nr:uncharacterized protein B0H18DRAFT_974101 [Neoantrodia serialis]KAH9936501.1 hypothetical protein B0H18DRAFT_974101 [Neoantrodia serialis]